ncbi:hypothetical protein TNIN_332651, partial [Trichonephila inaurata madagascariensis]
MRQREDIEAHNLERDWDMRNIVDLKESRPLKSSVFHKYLLKDTGSVRDIWLLE